MALTKGEVTIDAAGNASGGGLARALYDALVVKFDLPSGVYAQAPRQQIADLCNAMAEIVPYFVANAVVTTIITTSDAGLQQVEGENTEPPAANKTLSGTIT